MSETEARNQSPHAKVLNSTFDGLLAILGLPLAFSTILLLTVLSSGEATIEVASLKFSRTYATLVLLGMVSVLYINAARIISLGHLLGTLQDDVARRDFLFELPTIRAI